MDEEFIVNKSINELLLKNVNDFTGFVSRVMCDESFIGEMDRLLPFDKMVCASQNINDRYTVLKKLGIAVMRMDFSPALYSLAITLTVMNPYDKPMDFLLFIRACKTKEELSLIMQEEGFKQKVLSLCQDKIKDVWQNSMDIYSRKG